MYLVTHTGGSIYRYMYIQLTVYLSGEGTVIEEDVSLSLSRALHVVNTDRGSSGSPRMSHCSSKSRIWGGGSQGGRG